MEQTKIKAVPMVRRIRDAHHERLEGTTWEERVAFYREQASALHREIERKQRAGKDGGEAAA